ncbi:MAG TPA: NAD(P)H-binding protein [Blastocatellia bacterium]|nr:NAD(P)H-binding protein [Blastocatellia bacterium]
MKIAITGGTGFVGRHLARELARKGHNPVLISRGVDDRDNSVRTLDGAEFWPIGTNDVERLYEAFKGCYAVAHFAGINREIGDQTYRKVHIEGTHKVVEAARAASVKKILLLSFLRARPNSGSGYHESKWEAEDIVRSSGLDYTVLKSGMIYGKGDHMLDHLSHTMHTLPVLATVGFEDKMVRPVAVEDVVAISMAAILDSRLSNKTVAVVGPEEMKLSDAVRRVAGVLGKRVFIFPMPVVFHYLPAQLLELCMVVPLVAKSQVRILSENVAEPLPECARLPADLIPSTYFTDDQIRRGLPEAESFGVKDLRFCHRAASRM